LADYFVGKPGPGSLSEAVLMGLPVVVERNAWTMVQERYNTDWVRDQGLGVVLRSFGEIAQGVAPMLDHARLAGLRANVTALNNRAVFEIPDIIDTMFAPGASFAELNQKTLNYAPVDRGHLNSA
ncbi:MAG TPA: hypothetical protein VN754_09555, partial [Candidatus Binataceae bacterium]|nr:hypothetical protein [Candidatus Binataceae bacterium]